MNGMQNDFKNVDGAYGRNVTQYGDDWNVESRGRNVAPRGRNVTQRNGSYGRNVTQYGDDWNVDHQKRGRNVTQRNGSYGRNVTQYGDDWNVDHQKRGRNVTQRNGSYGRNVTQYSDDWNVDHQRRPNVNGTYGPNVNGTYGPNVNRQGMNGSSELESRLMRKATLKEINENSIRVKGGNGRPFSLRFNTPRNVTPRNVTPRNVTPTIVTPKRKRKHFSFIDEDEDDEKCPETEVLSFLDKQNNYNNNYILPKKEFNDIKKPPSSVIDVIDVEDDSEEENVNMNAVEKQLEDHIIGDSNKVRNDCPNECGDTCETGCSFLLARSVGGTMDVKFQKKLIKSCVAEYMERILGKRKRTKEEEANKKRKLDILIMEGVYEFPEGFWMDHRRQNCDRERTWVLKYRKVGLKDSTQRRYKSIHVYCRRFVNSVHFTSECKEFPDVACYEFVKWYDNHSNGMLQDISKKKDTGSLHPGSMRVLNASWWNFLIWGGINVTKTLRLKAKNHQEMDKKEKRDLVLELRGFISKNAYRLSEYQGTVILNAACQLIEDWEDLHILTSDKNLLLQVCMCSIMGIINGVRLGKFIQIKQDSVHFFEDKPYFVTGEDVMIKNVPSKGDSSGDRSIFHIYVGFDESQHESVDFGWCIMKAIGLIPANSNFLGFYQKKKTLDRPMKNVPNSLSSAVCKFIKVVLKQSTSPISDKLKKGNSPTAHSLKSVAANAMISKEMKMDASTMRFVLDWKKEKKNDMVLVYTQKSFIQVAKPSIFWRKKVNQLNAKKKFDIKKFVKDWTM